MIQILYTLHARTARFIQYLHARFSMSGRLLLIMGIVAFFFGINTQRSMLYQLFPFCLFLLFISYLFAFTRKKKVTVTPHFPETATSGQPVTLSVTISNITEKGIKDFFYEAEPALDIPTLQSFKEEYRNQYQQKPRPNFFRRKSGLSAWQKLTGHNKNAIAHPKEIHVIPSNSTIHITATITPQKRGLLKMAGSSTYHLDPLGLVKISRFHALSRQIIVLPKTYTVPTFHFSGSRKYHQGGLTASQDQGDAKEFTSLRDYKPGDSIKHMDWKATAKKNTFIVKQYKSEYYSRYGLILDTFDTHTNTPVFEEAISIGASILMGQGMDDDVLDLIFVETQCHIATSGKGIASRAHLLKILATITPATHSDFSELTGLVKSHLQLLSGLVIILLDLDKKRKELLDFLNKCGIPYKAILVCENEDTANSNIKEKKLEGYLHPITIYDTTDNKSIEKRLAEL